MRLFKGMLIVVFALSLFSSCDVAYDYECTKVVMVFGSVDAHERYATLPTRETADQWCGVEVVGESIISCDCVKIYE